MSSRAATSPRRLAHPPAAGVKDRARFVRRRSQILLAQLETSPLPPSWLGQPARSRSIVEMVVGATPGLSMEAQALVAEAGQLLFALDTLLADPELSDAERSLRIEQYASTGRGASCPEVAFDPIAVSLSHLRERLLAAPAGPALIEDWAGSLVRTMLAMRATRRANQAWLEHGTVPSLPAYLRAGGDSTGLALLGWTAWIAMGDPSTAEQLIPLRRAERCFATAVRLAADLRASEGEEGPGRLDAAAILSQGDLPLLAREAICALSAGRNLLARAGLSTDAGRLLESLAGGILALQERRDRHAAQAA